MIYRVQQNVYMNKTIILRKRTIFIPHK